MQHVPSVTEEPYVHYPPTPVGSTVHDQSSHHSVASSVSSRSSKSHNSKTNSNTYERNALERSVDYTDLRS